jgi:LPXTG-site transpeptidase (sortase) family protein
VTTRPPVEPRCDYRCYWPYRGTVHERAGRRLHLGTGRTWLRETGAAFVVVGLVVLLFVGFELVGTNFSEQSSQAKLAREFTSELTRAATDASSGAGTTPTTALSLSSVPGVSSRPSRRGGEGSSRTGRSIGTSIGTSVGRPLIRGEPLPVPPPGGALDHLVIPAIGVTRYVVQGVSDAELQMGPGHYPGTPLPGQLGNVAIAGHRTTFGAPFFRLNEVVSGDLIYLTDTSGTTWVYTVRHLWVVGPTDTNVLATSRQADLTLTTCNPRFEAISRLVVRAVLLERLARGTLLPGRLPVVESEQRDLPRPTGSAGPRSAGGPTSPRSTASNPAASSTNGARGRQTGASIGQQNGNGGAVGSVADTPTADTPTVGAAPADNTTGASAGGTWAATLSWAALALVAWTGTRVAAAQLRRYSKVAMLAAGTLLCLVPLWFVFENLVDLLPASI